jgi:hypothetical protein
MRTLLAIVILAVGMFTLSAPSDAARKAKRITKPHYAAQPRYSRQEVECERARHEDPAGDFAGYPCWARAALGGGRNIDNQ